MENQPITIERTYDAPSDKVWKAITEKDQIKQWSFDIPDFKAEVGHKFQFWGGDESRQFLHLCEIKEVSDGGKLSYSWRYEGYPGDSLVTFELDPEGSKTRLTLTHSGLETFQGDKHPELKKENFQQGWEQITLALADYIKNQ